MAINGGRQMVGILDAAEFAGEPAQYLSPAELQECAAVRNERRREEWMAGRLAAKFVFLHRERSEASGAELHLQKITTGDLAGFTPQDYRAAVVTKDPSPAGGPARIGWHARGETVKVAISHVNGLACAFIGSTQVYAVDLEARAARVPAFYAHNFTARERSWTSACARSFQLDSDWLYTLLWSVKECLLKTPDFATLSLWDMPAMEINVLSGSERLKAIHDAKGLTGQFEILQAEVEGRNRQWPLRLAVSGTADLVVTAITKLD